VERNVPGIAVFVRRHVKAETSVAAVWLPITSATAGVHSEAEDHAGIIQHQRIYSVAGDIDNTIGIHIGFAGVVQLNFDQVKIIQMAVG